MEVANEQKRRGLSKRRRRSRVYAARVAQKLWRDGDIIEKVESLGGMRYNIELRREGLERKIPALVLDNGLVILDEPRQDFSSRNHQTIAYSYSTQEYLRLPNLRRTAYKVYNHGPRLPDLDYELMAPCLESAPWIFNVAYLNVAGIQVKLRWGPNYLEPYQSRYCEITIGSLIVWKTSAQMADEIEMREWTEGLYVIDNQHLPLRMVRDRVMTPLNLCWGFPYTRKGYRVQVVYKSQPLITLLVTLREEGSGYTKYVQKMFQYLGAENFVNPRFLQGPQIEPEEWTVVQWKWVWRGLEPGWPHPSPLYKQLLEDRVCHRFPDFIGEETLSNEHASTSNSPRSSFNNEPPADRDY